MILHCKDFRIDSYPVTMGHDRETGKRYYVQEVNADTVQDLPAYLTSTVENMNQIDAIFWVKRGEK